MKVLNCFLFVVGLWLGLGQAWAQPPPCVSTYALPPTCTVPFRAIDVASNREVTAFCVGQTVRFEPCAARPITTTPPVYYGVLPGLNATYASAGCQPPLGNVSTTFTYTPQASDVGMVTVSESANQTGLGQVYSIRNFQVYGTPPPTFTIAPCLGNVLVTVTDNTYDSYTVQVGTITQPIARNAPTTIPVAAGATTVMVTGSYNAFLGTIPCNGSASQPIPIIAPARPAQITSLTLQAPLPGGTATLALSGLQPSYRYSLQYQPTAGGPFTNVPGVTITPTTPALTLPAVAGRYRIFSDDACSTSASQLLSNTIGTLSLTVTSANNRNQLLLADEGPGTSYVVTRNGTVITTTAILGGLEDANVQCGTTYTYVVTATQPDGVGRAVSNPVSIRTVSALPPAQPRLVASFNAADVVELTPLLNPPTLAAGSSLRYTRAAGGQTTDFNLVANARILRDSTAKLADLFANPPCYSVRLSDVCGTSPASNSACPALLTARAADPDGSTVTLNWTSFAGPDPTQPATYTLQRLAADGTVLPGSVVVTGNTYTDLTPPTDRQVARYRLQISGAGLSAGRFSYSNRASVTRRLTLTIPTAFTPNNDGLNDVLEVKGKYLNNYTFVVVDRNGQEVFRGTQRTETWDGTIKGHAPVLGAYVWRFQQNNEDDTPFSASGTVTILK
jgi:gliding motility-associated-like protein